MQSKMGIRSILLFVVNKFQDFKVFHLSTVETAVEVFFKRFSTRFSAISLNNRNEWEKRSTYEQLTEIHSICN